MAGITTKLTIDNSSLSLSNIIIHSILVFFISLLIYSVGLTGRPIFTRGEAREGLVIQAMIQQNNYILPVTNESKIAYKPPMFHWVGAICSKILGEISEFSVRLPSAITAALTLAFFFFYVAKISNPNRAILSVLILATSFEWFRSATQARVDMCFANGLVIALCSFHLAVSNWVKTRKIHIPYIALISISSAMAILSKGPGALIIIIAITVLYLLTMIEKPIIQSIFCLPLKSIFVALVISLAFACPWYYLAYIQGGDGFIDLHIMRENYARFVSVKGANQGHSKPFYYALIYFILALLPWSLLLPSFCAWTYRWGKKNLGLFRLKQLTQDREISNVVFSLIWVSVFILIVVASLAKRMVYYLQALPPMAYLLSVAIEDIWQNKKDYAPYLVFTKWASMFILSTAICVFLSFGIVDVFGKFLIEQNFLENTLTISYKNKILLKSFIEAKYIWLSSITVSVLLLFFAIKIHQLIKKENGDNKTLHNITKLIATIMILAFTASLSLFASPIAKAISPKDTMQKLMSTIPHDARLFGFEHTLYPAIYYANRPVTPTMQLSELSDLKENAYVLLESNTKQKFVEAFPRAILVTESNSLGANGEDKLAIFYLPTTK